MVVVPCCGCARSGGHAHTTVVTLLGCYCYSRGCGHGEVGGVRGCNGHNEVVHATIGCTAIWHVR